LAEENQKCLEKNLFQCRKLTIKGFNLGLRLSLVLDFACDEFEQMHPIACSARAFSKTFQLTGKALSIHQHLQSLGDHVQLIDLLSQ
jgi:hypothetical protein